MAAKTLLLPAVPFLATLLPFKFMIFCGTLRRLQAGAVDSGTTQKGYRALSTVLSQPTPSSWKEEVNLRLAAHRNRRSTGAVAAPAPEQMQSMASSRAAQAAARVAARYAQARSYSEMQAEEARVAVRAAEIATQVALEAQAHAEAKLATLDAVAQQPAPQPELIRSRPEESLQPQVSEQRWESPASVVAEPLRREDLDVRWEPELPARHEDFSSMRATLGRDAFEIPTSDWWAPAETEAAPVASVVEPAQPIPANLIEFPGELVATRKVRPRRVEGDHVDGMDAQLSIFEVDPATLSTEAEPVAREQAGDWRALDPESSPLLDDGVTETIPVKLPVLNLQQASINRRLMAAIVDGTLITGILLALVLMAGNMVSNLPPMHRIEMGAAICWAVVALVYQLFFFYVARATPGMKYASISLCTFDDQFPGRNRLLSRLAAMAFSIAPMGLGIAWALFDEEHLCWHDRISKTYQRKS